MYQLDLIIIFIFKIGSQENLIKALADIIIINIHVIIYKINKNNINIFYVCSVI